LRFVRDASVSGGAQLTITQDVAVAAAKNVSREYGRPIGPDLALRFLPLVAAQQLDAYDGWACRWLARWLNETPGVTYDRAAEVAASLAEHR
jgi:hypothetical protein